jgi:hypothetical protein
MSRSFIMPPSNLLDLAQQKLQATDVPFELRVAYYLRLSCTALDDPSVTYTGLMQELYAYNRQWIATCQVSSTGILMSSDRTIEAMLSVITALHQPELLLENHQMMAA